MWVLMLQVKLENSYRGYRDLATCAVPSAYIPDRLLPATKISEE